MLNFFYRIFKPKHAENPESTKSLEKHDNEYVCRECGLPMKDANLEFSSREICKGYTYECVNPACNQYKDLKIKGANLNVWDEAYYDAPYKANHDNHYKQYYRCRMCGESFAGSGRKYYACTEDAHGALEKMQNQIFWSEDKEPVSIHLCSDGRIGFSDFIGYSK